MVKTITIMILVSLFLVAGQINLKTAVTLFNDGLNFSTVQSFFYSGKFWIAIAFTGTGGLLWLYVISYEKLSVAYPLISFSYIFMAIWAYYKLEEPLTSAKIAGILTIMVGVVLLFK
ncbi:MAG: EamA family transporter [Spirochaetia bacterium]|nr:EamA family transporter [Spirochaetia bacterium]